MAYVKQNFRNGNILDASELTHIEDGIAALERDLNNSKQDILNEVLELLPGGGGITPSGTLTITQNGTHDVTSYAKAHVNVPTTGGDVVYGEDIEVDSLSELHTWSKYTIGGTVNETLLDSLYVDLALKDSVDGRVYYADDYSTVDGVLTLSNPTLIDLYDSIQANREVIRGKYINLVKNGGYYRVPNDAVITASKPSTGYHYISIAPVYHLSYSDADGEFVCLVVSEDSNAYPQNGEQGGYKYVYNGTLDDAGGCDHVTVTQAVPSITVSESGLITATSEQDGGLIAAGTKTATQQLPTQGAVAVKPGASSKTAVVAGKYTTGDVIVMGDSQLVESNIKSGASIFGVTGTCLDIKNITIEEV